MRFIYCEAEECGMDTQIFTSFDELRLYGWMDEDCKEKDKKLMRWAESAEIGEYYEHRLGVCIRLKDIE